MSHSVKAVRYVGDADVRTISKKDWASVNVAEQKETTWSVANEKVLPGADFTDGAIQFFEGDPEFKLEMEKSGA